MGTVCGKQKFFGKALRKIEKDDPEKLEDEIWAVLSDKKRPVSRLFYAGSDHEDH